LIGHGDARLDTSGFPLGCYFDLYPKNREELGTVERGNMSRIYMQFEIDDPRQIMAAFSCRQF
jgi:hypothetical protein